jgi:hypothetical protein
VPAELPKLHRVQALGGRSKSTAPRGRSATIVTSSHCPPATRRRGTSASCPPAV